MVVLSVETESMGAQIGRERRPFRLGSLPGLVFRPAVKTRLAKFGVGALLLLGDGMQRIAPAVVVIDFSWKRAVVVTIERPRQLRLLIRKR